MRLPAFIAAVGFCLASLVAFSQPAYEKKQEAERLQKQGEAALERANYKEALGRLEEALKLYEELGEAKRAGDCLCSIGQVYRGLADYAKARDYCTRALKLHEKIGDEQGAGRDLSSLGRVLEDLADYEKALT